MSDEGNPNDLLKEAMTLDHDTIIVCGVKDSGGSVLIHNVETDLDAAFLLKTFVATLDMSILEELYGRTKRNLN